MSETTYGRDQQRWQMVVSRTCKTLRDNGEPCRAAPLRDGDFCRMHSPELEQDVQERRRVGGMRRRKEVTLQAIDLSVPPEQPEIFEKGYGDETVKALLFGIKEGVQQHWCELRAIAIGVQEVAEEFGGEDPLHADMRELVDDGLRSCEKQRDDVAGYVEIELAEPSDDDVAQVRKLIEKAVEG